MSSSNFAIGFPQTIQSLNLHSVIQAKAECVPKRIPAVANQRFQSNNKQKTLLFQDFVSQAKFFCLEHFSLGLQNDVLTM